MNKTCTICNRKKASAELIADECYLCILAKGLPSGYFNTQLYKKAVSVALAFGTPLTLRQARRVTRVVWMQYRNKDQAMRVLAGIRDCRIVPENAGADFYKRVMKVLR